MPGPQATPEEIGEFWDTHSLADYWDETEAVECQVNLKRSHQLLPLEHQLARQLREYATRQGLSMETLANLWLRERLMQVPKV